MSHDHHRKENKMTNYDMDELRRRGEIPNEVEKRREFAKDIIESEKNKKPSSVEIGKEEEPWMAVDIELKDEDFMRIAKEAQKRDITFNKMINIILKNGIKDAQHRFEHDSRPQLLNETE